MQAAPFLPQQMPPSPQMPLQHSLPVVQGELPFGRHIGVVVEVVLVDVEVVGVVVEVLVEVLVVLLVDVLVDALSLHSYHLS